MFLTKKQLKELNEDASVDSPTFCWITSIESTFEIDVYSSVLISLLTTTPKNSKAC